MKVLMFGWEFPPHISGGLGIACHGITSALTDDDVEVLFVVPSLHSEEKVHHGQFIDASKIVVPISNEQLPTRLENLKKIRTVMSHINEQEAAAHPESATSVSLPITLSPYYQPIESDNDVVISHWNYSFADKFTVDRIFPRQPEVTIDVPQGISYEFTGAYGPTLLEEVEKYAIVARTISRQYYFNIIHAHDWMTFRAGIEAKKVSHKPLVVHIHATEFDRAGINGQQAVYDLEREGMMAADRVIAVSERTKSLAVLEYNIPEEKIVVVHNGISPAPQIARYENAPIGSHIVSFLGRVTYQKGPLYFVEAARKVLEQFPNAHFIVSGAGDLLPAMIERVAQLRISSNFHFTGFIAKVNVEKIWAMSDVYVMPSVSEPFGIAPLEAIQAGVPVIISNQAGVGEVMPHAIKIDFWNTSALAEAICSVLKYKSLSRTLKKNSNEEIKNISWTKASKKIKTLYYELTTKARRYP